MQIVAPALVGKFLKSCSFFPTRPPGLEKFAGFYAGERKEHINLTLAQLRAGCLVLSDTCQGGGTIFPVGKAGGRQREPQRPGSLDIDATNEFSKRIRMKIVMSAKRSR